MLVATIPFPKVSINLAPDTIRAEHYQKKDLCFLEVGIPGIEEMKTSLRLFATDHLDELIKWVVPTTAGLHLHQLIMAADELTLVMRSSSSVVSCPLCGQETSRVHSHYHRTLQDLPWGQLRVQLRLQVHRFFCQNPCCARKIFTEPLPDLAERSARRTDRLREALLVMGWALGGEAGARQCAAHAMPISGTTLLTLLRRHGVAAQPTTRILGVDDWSCHARTTGTILVDLERHQPVEVLLGSDEQVLAPWLLAHPGVEVISRDRGASYLKGACKGAPNATQVLDRWHLLKNLGDVLQQMVHGGPWLKGSYHEAKRCIIKSLEESRCEKAIHVLSLVAFRPIKARVIQRI